METDFHLSKSFFIAPVWSQMPQDSNKLEETRSFRGARGRDSSRQTLQRDKTKRRTFFNFPLFVSLFNSIPKDAESNNSFFTMCLNPVHRQRVCEKLYHKMGYERKKNWLKKREHAQFRLMSSSCVTSLSFSVFFFFSVSLPLSRFNKASCRAWPSWERQQSVAGAEAELGWVVVAAGVQVGGGARTSDHFPHAIQHAVWRLGKQPTVLSPPSSFLSPVH